MPKFETKKTGNFKITTDKHYFENSFDLPNPNLLAYFGRVEEGNSEEYRTPFYKKAGAKEPTPLEEILDGWSHTLDTIKDEWPTLWEFENDLRKKVGPMSIMKPLNERLDDIGSYYESILLDSKPVSSEAKQLLLKEWVPKIGGLRVRGLDKTIDQMKKSTSSGSPFWSKRRLVTDRTLPAEIDFTNMTQTCGNSEYNCVATLGWRGQEGGPSFDDVKQRVIWMFPYALNMRELQVYQPLIVGCQKHQLVPAWVGMDAVDAEITQLFDTKGADDLIICTDFTKFDQHFNHDMQECARDLYQHLLAKDSESKKWLSNVFPVKYRIPLVVSKDKIVFGDHGMASGSGGTNADETIVHRTLQHEAAYNAGAVLNPHSQCLGDDGILSYPGITVDDVVQTYSSHGQVMNADKQYASTTTCIYLRRWHHKDYRINGICAGVYSTYRALGRLAEQERFYDPDKWSKEMVTLRYLSILENVKYHPLREQFVDYCMKGDKYRLGLDIPGFLEHINKYAKEANDLIPDFLGYTKSNSKDAETPPSKWWVVEYLMTKA